MESLESRNLLAVGLPTPSVGVEPGVDSSAFYATELVERSSNQNVAIDVSSVLREVVEEDFLEEFEATSPDDFFVWLDEYNSEAQSESDSSLYSVEYEEEPATVMTLSQYFNSMGIKDYSFSPPRDVYFYSSVDPECDLTTLDFSNESILFVDLGARDDQVWNLVDAFQNVIMRSGGGSNPPVFPVPDSAGEMVGIGSTAILEVHDGSASAPSDATYFRIQTPEVPLGYNAYIEFRPVSVVDNPGALYGTDFGIIAYNESTQAPA